MAIKSRDILKTYFENGDKPDENQFSDLIDSLIHVTEGGTGTNSSTGTGIISGITTDENGNIVFNFVGGSSMNVTSNGAVGVVKMPIPYVESYDNFYFVSKESGDDLKASPNSYRFYKSITAAVKAARTNFDASKEKNKNMVYVFPGTYNEANIIRNHVDMYFEDGTVVWAAGAFNSVITDFDEVLNEVKVYGKGTFTSSESESYDNREGINLGKESTLYVEAKLVDSIQLQGEGRAKLKLVNADIIFNTHSWHNKEMIFENCKFLNGLRLGSFEKNNGREVYKNCEFILPLYPTTDDRNKSVEIKDYNGNTLFRSIQANSGAKEVAMDTAGKNLAVRLKEVYDKYTVDSQTANPEVSCIFYSQNNLYDLGNFRVEFKQCTCRIQKENGIGIILSKRKNSESNEEGYVLLNDITIIDETKTKESVALATGWGDQATKQPGLMVNSLSSNCSISRMPIVSELSEWKITFNQIPEYVPKSGGQFTGDVLVGNPEKRENAGVLLGKNGDLVTVHNNAEGNLFGKGLEVSYNNWQGANQNVLQFWANPSRINEFDQTFQIGYLESTKNVPSPVHWMQMFQSNSIFSIGGWFEGKGTGEGFKKGDKFRVIDGNAEIDGELRAKNIKVSESIFENGIRLATQTWVNNAITGLGSNGTNISNLESKGQGDVKTGRSVWDDGIHTYNTHTINKNKPAGLGYGSSIVWGRGTKGSAELMAGWTSGDQNHLYYRSLRDVSDNWWDWKRIYHTGYKPTAKDVGALAINAKARDSDKLDGIDASGFVRKGVDAANSWNNEYLIFSRQHADNVDAISYNDASNGFYFNADRAKNNSSANANVYVGDLYADGTSYYGDRKKMFLFSDDWLRLNPSNDFANGIYCGTRVLRTDGQLEVGVSGRYFKVSNRGTVTAAGNITAYSDRRLKNAIKPVKESFLEKIVQLKPSYYRWKDTTQEQTRQLGFIAQDLINVFPEWVHKNGRHYSVSYDKMGAVLAVKGIQELFEELERVKLQLKELQYAATY